MTNPRLPFTLGLILLFVGVIVPFLMVIQILTPTFLWVFVSSGSSTLGLSMGMIGLAHLSRNSKKK